MRFTSTINKAMIIFAVAGVALFFADPFVSFLDWRSYYPLPAIPYHTPRYTVVDKGQTRTYLDPMPLFQQLCLRDDGTIRDAREDDETPSESRIAKLRRLTGWSNSSDNYARSVASNGYGLVRRSTEWERYLGPTAQEWKPSGPVRGYHWGLYQHSRLLKINVRGDVIGNKVIATAPPSCTRPYHGHGRGIPLLWRHGQTEAEDLNTQIAENSGWYIDQTLDITDDGRILCVARRTDARGAKPSPTWRTYLVILDPIGPP